ncbi:MAG: metallophosphoesterase [Saprospiraceae bacterium]|nr:metallophosphoesterase [Saprospiraceae bacterium]
MIAILFVFAFLFLFDWYAFQGIRTLTSGWDNETLRLIVHTLFWGMHLVLPILLLYSAFQMQKAHKMSTLGVMAGNTLVTILIAQLVFVLVLFGADILRFCSGVFHWIQTRGTATLEKQPFMPERRKFVSQVALLTASVPFFSFVYGILKGKYDYTVHRYVLKFKDLPEAFHGFTITQISDVHAGSFDDPTPVQRGVDMIKAQKSDLFLFTGDLVNNEAVEFEPWKDMFGAIKAPYGQFSVLGNHDYGDYAPFPSPEAKRQNLEDLKRLQAEAGYRLLLDEHVDIEKDGQKIQLIGIQNWGHGFSQYGDFEKALSNVDPDTFKILLSHDPSHFEYQVKDHPQHIHLTLSGHTHGMQMGIEIPGFIRWSPSKFRYPRWAGIYEANGRTLNVNRGFGFLGFRGRVGIWPEITVIELQRES